MSGGFFRGTSADQDTRFSNKQAKLLKSQKFPPELDHLVDVTKVKMDVIRPWIATRATEFLGFEDEVLINFIYGLLEGKIVDGKKIQIQLTGFMEKNTRKFMKELWGLLLSAQGNASGIPQQFLDAKEEEIKKKKVESDRITQEIQRRKEKSGWESEQDRKNRMDGNVDILGHTDSPRNDNLATELGEKQSSTKATIDTFEDEVDVDQRHNSRRKIRHSLSPRPNGYSPRSYRERNISRSLSGTPRQTRHSISPEKRHRSPSERPISPRRMSRSPPRRRSPRSRKRSVSRSRYLSPSPIRRRSPLQRRSPSPLRRRFSPLRRHRTPPRHRSPTGRHYQSPARRRSPVNLRRASPLLRRSPFRRRTPPRHSSRSPSKRSSRSPRYPKRSPVRSPKRHMTNSRNSPLRREKSCSPSKSQSPLNRSRRSLSKDHDSHSNGVGPRKHHADYGSQRSPVRTFSDRGEARKVGSRYTEPDPALQQPISLRSPQRGTHGHNNKIHASSAVTERDSPEDKDIRASERRKRKYSPEVTPSKEVLGNSIDSEKQSTERPAVYRSKEVHSVRERVPDHDASHNGLSEKHSSKSSPYPAEEVEYGPGRSTEHSAAHLKEDRPSEKSNVISVESNRSDDKKQRHREDDSLLHQSYANNKKEKKPGNIENPMDSDSDDDSRHKRHSIHKNSKRPDKKEALSDDDGYASPNDGLNEAKRRKKEEKKLRKEEKRRKREERHRRREERRAGKLKAKYVDRTSPSSDHEKGHGGLDSDGSAGPITDALPSNKDETEFEQKKLEIQLREKALESLRAKKAVTH